MEFIKQQNVDKEIEDDLKIIMVEENQGKEVSSEDDCENEKAALIAEMKALECFNKSSFKDESNNEEVPRFRETFNILFEATCTNCEGFFVIENFESFPYCDSTSSTDRE